MKANSRFLLWLFVALQFLSLSRQVLISLYGEQMNVLGLTASVLSVPVFVFLIVSVHNTDRPGWLSALPGWAPPWILICLLLVGLAYLHGMAIRGQSIKAATQDFVPYLYVFGAIVIGSKPQVLEYLLKPLFAFFCLAILINLYGLTDIGGIAARSAAGSRIARDSLSYETQSTLAAWPLLLLLVNRMKIWQAVTVFSGVVLFAGMQILFQKRLGVATVGMMVVLYTWQSISTRHLVDRHLIRGSQLYTGLLVATVCTAFALTLIVAPGLLVEQASSLLDRLAGREVQLGYSRGAFSVFTLENERIRIAIDCFSSFSPYEWLVGRGMGGAYEWSTLNSNMLSTDRAGAFVTQYLLEDLGIYGRRDLETGFLMPLLKGGLLLWLAFFYGPIRVIAQRASLALDYQSSAAYYTCLFLLILSVQSGFLILSETLGLLVFGVALGRCLFAQVVHSGAPPALARRAIPR